MNSRIIQKVPTINYDAADEKLYSQLVTLQRSLRFLPGRESFFQILDRAREDYAEEREEDHGDEELVGRERAGVADEQRAEPGDGGEHLRRDDADEGAPDREADAGHDEGEGDRKSTRLHSSHVSESRMPSS